RIAIGLQDVLLLGNLDAKRDWGYAPEYCEGMWKILQHKKADDFVLSTGETHTVREFTELTFKEIGIELEWKGKEQKEAGFIKNINWGKAKKLLSNGFNKEKYSFTFSEKLRRGTKVISIDPNYYRPTEVDLLIGDSSKAKRLLGWKAKTKFEKLVHLMIKNDLEKVLVRGY
ncbi:MAG: GDP-mannose 4,6-dehydratase, partial [Ignavibacteriaceae bacterium]